jgi:hypothetical protein
MNYFVFIGSLLCCSPCLLFSSSLHALISPSLSSCALHIGTYPSFYVLVLSCSSLNVILLHVRFAVLSIVLQLFLFFREILLSFSLCTNVVVPDPEQIRIQISNKVTIRTRIRIKVISRIRIRIKVMRIRNTAGYPAYLCFLALFFCNQNRSAFFIPIYKIGSFVL